MCLVKVRQEEDVVVPYRTVRTRSPPHRHSHSTRRISRTEIVHESPRPSRSYVAVPAPKPLPIPAPQPVPVFVEPPPSPFHAPPPPPSHVSSHHGPHYVEVSPRSSVTSHSPSRSEYVVHEREYRRERRDHSPERYEHYRYVEPPPSESDHFDRYERRRSRSRVRERSLSRGRGGYGPEYGERVTRERITIVDDDGRRRREYRR
ncbi:hypothetical protein BU26DRAFT_131985 [Trematosphaeria pertusa]|uniref:Uncharacterized protein n=1 Tax=Trematosphaeria pertusa TaxID=390896 RepID=A0A6A6HZG9_9PLEO|nr:uncharacterized protein BU26DRAFT_131985 [Trematosphaeria pertusa]KAF2242740.1 hypothetical protein BU26DRAFT_131985 [Trematosphaeria pertusa]